MRGVFLELQKKIVTQTNKLREKINQIHFLSDPRIFLMIC